MNATTIEKSMSLVNDGDVIVDRSWNVDDGVTIKGPGRLLVDPGQTITLGKGSRLVDVEIISRKMLEEGVFWGSSLKVKGDNVRIIDCRLMGFLWGVYCQRSARTHVVRTEIDCVTAVLLAGVLDTSHIDIHAWPFLKHEYGFDHLGDFRDGYGVALSGPCDWVRVSV